MSRCSLYQLRIPDGCGRWHYSGPTGSHGLNSRSTAMHSVAEGAVRREESVGECGELDATPESGCYRRGNCRLQCSFQQPSSGGRHCEPRRPPRRAGKLRIAQTKAAEETARQTTQRAWNLMSSSRIKANCRPIRHPHRWNVGA